ncbi:uncharacterized protein LOC122922080 isoform X2 [Bufo gargarizans]|uniref:uncharacterized protein LOC122922080 isoform X2 n=1 Tax=Bufo gargarizans TaxID=30331 RepID=UPI001CF35784|nr:uncharacterized protein LOC122922080 isoform X2 [Bufo gargarizans]
MGKALLSGFIFLLVHKAALSEKSCGATINVQHIEGGQVTLPVDEIGIRNISWRRASELTYITRTEPGKLHLIQSSPYKVRLNVTADGSLIITKLHKGDQGLYRAEIVRRTLDHCVQLYDLKVPGAEELVDYKALNLARLILSVFLVVIICCVLIHHLMESST